MSESGREGIAELEQPAVKIGILGILFCAKISKNKKENARPTLGGFVIVIGPQRPEFWYTRKLATTYQVCRGRALYAAGGFEGMKCIARR